MPKKPFTVDTLNNATFDVTTKLNNYQMAIDDPDKGERIKDQRCQGCYYAGRLALNSTIGRPAECAKCPDSFRSFHVTPDVLCLECAKRMQVCRQCGADLELKQRNVLERKKK